MYVSHHFLDGKLQLTEYYHNLLLIQLKPKFRNFQRFLQSQSFSGPEQPEQYLSTPIVDAGAAGAVFRNTVLSDELIPSVNNKCDLPML